MDYEPTEAELNGLSGDEMATDEAQAAFYEQEAAAREEWERQAYYHHEQEQQGWDDGEYEQMMFEVEGH
ncbi:hypothetical protein MON38_14960 [Hymenobacter sp. DH14]|uniref:Uncharacterized protein n=1 Tax=Hymenobacter cyanobacteriorum TaxID=2926463 RepID=A0A9X2AIK4_9BACT|nr:hypothetical protein [Hymenobacter cyanobacteriorum]MCI1188725.1 hypothetical protein [Hymenobacter cyanobacteriorum]